MSRKQRGSPITSPHTASIRKSPSTQTLMALLPEHQGYQFIRQEKKAKSESDLQEIRENRMKREMEREMIKEQNKEIEQPFRPLTRRQTMEFESPFQMQQRERPRYDPVFVDNFQSDLVDDKPAEDTNELPRPKPMRRSITLEGLDFSDKLGGGKKVRKRKNKTKKKRKSKGGDRTDRDYQLYIAAREGNANAVINMLDEGADINKGQIMGYTPLFIASQNGHVEVVRILLERGADIDQVLNNGTTPLIMASYNGHVEVVGVLVEKGADINKANSEGTPPLFMASDKGHVEVVRMLLEHGADINKADDYGFTPLFIASQKGHVEVENLLKKYMLEIIIERTVERQELVKEMDTANVSTKELENIYIEYMKD